MQGTFKIDDKSERNIITNVGHLQHLDAIAGKSRASIQSIAVGIGRTTETADDATLEFTVAETAIDVVLVNYEDQQVLYKATLPEADQYVISEIGTYLRAPAAINTFYSFKGIEPIQWIDEEDTCTYDAEFTRFSGPSVHYEAATDINGSATITADFSSLQPTSEFAIAYYCDNLTSLSLQLETTDADYFSKALTTTDGYRVDRFAKSTFTTTGSPDWKSINKIRILAAGTSATLSLDAIQYAIITQDAFLFSRKVLAEPIVKLAGIKKDIEYLLEQEPSV